jgi:hypothetical protein
VKRFSLAMIATLAIAHASAAAGFFVDTDKASHLVGDSILITVTDTVDPAGESLNPFDSYALSIGWDENVAFVQNSGVSNPPFGNSSQSPILAGLSGIASPSCANTGNTCTVINQVNASQAPVNVAGGSVVVGTLVLEAFDLGSLQLAITSFSNLGSTDASAVQFRANAQTAVIPEPTTAALLCLGLLGLGVARRRSTG